MVLQRLGVTWGWLNSDDIVHWRQMQAGGQELGGKSHKIIYKKGMAHHHYD